MKVEIINELFQEIVEAENYIQSYILSGDLALESFYLHHTNEAHLKIKELRMLVQGDYEQMARVDSLESLFLTKLVNLQGFLKIKEQHQQSVFSGQALKKITQRISDSTTGERQLLKREFVKGDYVPAEKETVLLIPDDHKGVKGFFRKMLGIDKERLDTIKTVEKELLFSAQVRVDTSVMTIDQPDSTLIEVKTILKGVMREEQKIQKQISKRELSLLQQDREFIAKMRGIIKDLRSQAGADLRAFHLDASETAERTTRLIIGVGLVGLVMSGFFLFLILKDMTGAYFYRMQLEKEKIRTEKLAKVKEEFVSNMSHEMRTPLQSIQGFSELISQTPLNDQQTLFLKAIKYSNNYLSQLINDVLDEAKIEAGMTQFVFQPFDLLSIVEELRILHNRAASEKGLVLNIDTSGEDLSKISLIGDEVKLRQILINLVNNAIKFTDNGEVNVSFSTKIESDIAILMISVQDTGCGVAEELKSVIFDPFTQEKHFDREKNYRGTGLGLSISKKITEAMGGSIAFESQKNVGTKFTVILKFPFEWSDSTQESSLQNHMVNNSGKLKACIMVVEDDGWNATLLKEILLKIVTKVMVFQNANKAFAYIQESGDRVDLIFTDIQMPEMTGIQFLVKLRSTGFTMPLIALTAHVQAEKLHELKSEGFDSVYSKPYKSMDIHKILDEYLVSAQPESPLKKTKIKPHSSKKRLIDFSIIKQFSGEDETSFRELLNTLVENNYRQIMQFESYLKNERIEELADLCHQMRTTYDNLSLYTIAESLASVELHYQMSNFSRSLESARDLKPELFECFDQLKSMVNSQSGI